MSDRATPALLQGKKGLVLNIANDRSIAYHIARQAFDHGATVGCGALPNEKMMNRAEKAMQEGGFADAFLAGCDVSDDASIEQFFAAAGEKLGKIDFLVHSLAFADREYLKIGKFLETPRNVFAQALDISAYSLIALARAAAPMMNDGGSIVCLSYLGAEKAVPGYNVMGVAKAALESAARYLALELGARQIRVNSISAGPVRTLSAMAVGGIDEMFDHTEKKAPLHRNIEPEEVGRCAVYLLSDLSTGTTGQTVYVDSGFNIVGL
jgi:enoyl-[acyl-carrier protein] reductase I